MTDHEWYLLVKDGSESAWREVWARVVEPEIRKAKNREMMDKFMLSPDDLTGMLYEEMIVRGKIDLYRDDGGSFAGWLRSYVRGFIKNSNPKKHGELSIDNAFPDGEDGERTLEIPVEDFSLDRSDVWRMTHLCFRDLWNSDPEKAYIMLFKTRFHLSSDEVRDILDVSSSANVDQIFSRSVKFMRKAWVDIEGSGGAG